MRRTRMLVVAAVAASTITVTAAPAQARCLPEFAVVCHVITTVCRATGNPCYA